MAHSKTAAEYDKSLDELKSSNMKSVIEYVLQNWDPIKDQWVTCFKDTSFNLGETTNNRLESTFSKIKNVCSRYASLMQFFSEFFCVLKSLRDHRNHHHLMAITRKKTEFENLGKDLQLFCNCQPPMLLSSSKNNCSLQVKLKYSTIKTATSLFFLPLKMSKSHTKQHHHAAIVPFFLAWVYHANTFSRFDLYSTFRLLAKA